MNAMRGFISLAIGLILACCTRFKEERHQSDYEKYLAQIRETKMSEMAKGDLERTVVWAELCPRYSLMVRRSTPFF